jgi:hypothetical protein
MHKFVVELELPEDASVAEAKQYIKDAVSSWHGSLFPGSEEGEYADADPMFDLDGDTIVVKSLRRPPVKKEKVHFTSRKKTDLNDTWRQNTAYCGLRRADLDEKPLVTTDIKLVTCGHCKIKMGMG